ncbi:hypothetical protein [Ruminococcus callidus]|jgi:hypothetical protein|uniref:hypothetical protein n=1 Tax=Ruminococcus callidus TaxID=40519 RepID=UPI001D1168F6|nr:hypothetical protein [Ruminococcus callidus]
MTFSLMNTIFFKEKITQKNTVAALDAKNPCPPEKVAGEQGLSITSVSKLC